MPRKTIRLITAEQWSELRLEDVRSLLKVMTENDTAAEIDWVNRTIRVLGPITEHPTVKMSDGEPMTYQDIHFELSGCRDRVVH